MVYAEFPKVVVLGPESTGKSTLCEMLAQHYESEWCPEFARKYLLTNGRAYTYDDLLTIAKGQIALEEECLTALKTNHAADADAIPPPYFVDTDMYVMKVWCEYVFNQCHTWILNRIVERTCNLYLLCVPDLPWVPDELREYPDEKPRQELYHMYRDILINQPVPWVEIRGSYEERLQMAVKAVDGLSV
jgi:NadR type nicotinamide-nucleotide adenylyltransferase